MAGVVIAWSSFMRQAQELGADPSLAIPVVRRHTQMATGVDLLEILGLGSFVASGIADQPPDPPRACVADLAAALSGIVAGRHELELKSLAAELGIGGLDHATATAIGKALSQLGWSGRRCRHQGGWTTLYRPAAASRRKKTASVAGGRA